MAGVIISSFAILSKSVRIEGYFFFSLFNCLEKAFVGTSL